MSETKPFEGFLEEQFAKNPGLKLDMAIAGILIDVQLVYYDRLKNTPENDAVGGFEKQEAEIKALIATEVEGFAAKVKGIPHNLSNTPVHCSCTKADIDRLLAEWKEGAK